MKSPASGSIFSDSTIGGICFASPRSFGGVVVGLNVDGVKLVEKNEEVGSTEFLNEERRGHGQ